MSEITEQTKITKPMLSGKFKQDDDIEKVQFPVGASPKLDGIRCLKVDGKIVSRTFKPIKNDHIRTTLEASMPDGIDGELMSGTTFQHCTSAVMTISGEPVFQYYVFDYVQDSIDKPYMERMMDLQQWWAFMQPEHVKLVLPKIIDSLDELHEFEAQCLAEGYEGVMIRSLDGPYKCGRGTMREGYLMKIKRFTDAEAEVIGYEEQLHNANEATKDAFGRTERSSHKENKIPAGVLGKVIVRDLETGIEFGCGTGFDAEQREVLWKHRDSLIGQIIKYKSFKIGVKEAPRHPVFLGWRDPDDM